MLVAEGKDGAFVWALQQEDDFSWAMMPRYLERVAAFSRNYDSDANVETLQRAISTTFASPYPGGLFLLYVDPDFVTPLGHLLVTMESWFGTRMATVVQYELDRGLAREVMAKSLAFVENWARSNGAEFLQALAVNEKVARVYSTYDGFVRNRIMMRKTLRPSTGVAQGTPGTDNAA